jgi:hypothetical protein
MRQRRYQFYSLPVGGEIVVPDLKWLQQRIYEHGWSSGKVFRTRRVGTGRRVTRVA